MAATELLLLPIAPPELLAEPLLADPPAEPLGLLLSMPLEPLPLLGLLELLPLAMLPLLGLLELLPLKPAELPLEPLAPAEPLPLVPELPLPMELLPLMPADPLVDGDEVEAEPEAAVFNFGCPVA